MTNNLMVLYIDELGNIWAAEPTEEGQEIMADADAVLSPYWTPLKRISLFGTIVSLLRRISNPDVTA